MPDPQGTLGAPMILDPVASQRNDGLRYVLDFVDKSDSFRRRYVDMWDELLANYMVTFDADRRRTDPVITSRYSHYRGARLKDPETNQVVESLSAQALSLAFGQRDYCQALPIGLDDPEKARLISRLIMALLEEPNTFMTNYLGFKDAFIFGTAIMEMGYERCQRMQMGPGGPAMVTYKDSPLLRPVDIYDFYPDPTGTRIQQDMIGVAKRFRITKSQAEALIRYGVYDELSTRRAMQVASDRDSKSPRGDDRFSREDKRVPHDTGILTGFEYWGEVPYITSDGATNRVITVLGGEVVRDSINPFFDGAIPFKEIVINPIAGRFYGLSPGEIIRFLQDSADNLLMAVNDGVDLAINSPLLVGSAFGGDPNRLKNRSTFDIIPCSNPEAVMPVPCDFNALTLATADLARRKQDMREAGGATNPVQAIPSGDRTTATEINTLAQMASQRVGLMVQIYERDYLPWYGRTALSRLQQFAPPNVVATLQGEQFAVDLRQINVPADVNFVGSIHAITKGQKVQQLQTSLSVLSNPDIVMMYPDIVMRLLRDGLDIKDAPVIVQNALKALQLKMLVETMQNMAGGGAKEQPGQASQPSQSGATTDTQGAGASSA